MPAARTLTFRRHSKQLMNVYDACSNDDPCADSLFSFAGLPSHRLIDPPSPPSQDIAAVHQLQTGTGCPQGRDKPPPSGRRVRTGMGIWAETGCPEAGCPVGCADKPLEAV